MPSQSSRSGPALALTALAALVACRQSNPPAALQIPVNTSGVNGCVTPDQSFASAPQPVALGTLQVSEWSQVTAATGATLLYATGADGQVVEVDMSNPAAPVERELLAGGEVVALLATSGITDAPVVSGIAVASESTLLVIEHTANVVLAVNRITPGLVEYYAGLPSTTPGNADGIRAEVVQPGEAPARARFSFEEPCQLMPLFAADVDGELDAQGQAFVVDSGNHALRLIEGTIVTTVAGRGTPGTFVGAFSNARFDTPSGITGTCEGTLLVTELGDYGEGQVVRDVSFRAVPDFLGELDGLVDILVGDKMSFSTEGVTANMPGMLAQVSRPASPLATNGGEVYWIDSGTGVLRRLSGDFVDCPMAADCATAVTTPAFTPGGTASLTQAANGDLYVLDSAAGVLFRLAN